MPADSRRLADEGVVIAPQVLDDEGGQRRSPTSASRRSGAPTCAPSLRRTARLRRLAELALRRGTARLREAWPRCSTTPSGVPACIDALEDGERTALDVLEAAEDGDLELRLTATVRGESFVLDFTGSAPQHEGNLNCPLAVTRSACYFAVRVLTDPDIPASAGAYRPVTVIAPEGRCSTRAPGASRSPRGRRAGNVETSSRVADLVLAAFGRALGQGTMNNLTLGDDGFTYYETLGGGQGLCPDADGPSAVHVAMSNTLNTPVEALELEFPLRVVEYAVRRGSGGAGRHRGGDGLVRELEALAPMTFSLITERRRHAPPGADGGEPGARAQPDRRPGAAARRRGRLSQRGAAADRDAGRRRVRRWPGAISRSGMSASAFIGLGIMGSRMAANLRAGGLRADGLQPHPWRPPSAGQRSTVRRSQPIRPRSPPASDIVITMVVDGAQVEAALLLGRASWRRPRGERGLLCVDMSTIAPSRDPPGASAQPSVASRFVDAPVTGLLPQSAEDGTLTIMAGGERPTSRAPSRSSRRWAS